MIDTLSRHIRHFFHVVSNVRPIVWICLYVGLVPVFALIYMWLPDSQFRIPDGSGTDYGSWLYYSIVTISTLGFGDYTPAHGWAQAVTAVEVISGLSIFGFFLNAVGSMKSEIDVESEIEKQRALHEAAEKDKLVKSIPLIMHDINRFMAACYAVTTPVSMRGERKDYNPSFSFNDLADLYHPVADADGFSSRTAVTALMDVASRTSLYLDSIQTRIDLSIWPDLLEDCFSFVANYQMFYTSDTMLDRMARYSPETRNMSIEQTRQHVQKMIADYNGGDENGNRQKLSPYFELYNFIKKNASLAQKIETELTSIAESKS